MDKGLEADREPQRRAARETIAESARLPFQRKDLVSAAHYLPRLLQRHGLGQTLAFLQMRASTAKGPGPYEVLLRSLDRWLRAARGAAGRTALAALSSRDSRYYLEASAQAWLFVRALSAELEEESA